MAPRKPAHLRTLEFREAADFLQKLNREIARVRDVKETTDVIDHATNAAMTAWYLTDWVWHDIEEDRTAAPFRLLAKTAGKPIRSLHGFQTFVRAASVDVLYCESIAVASKHFGSSGREFSSAVQQRTEETNALTFTTSHLGTEVRHMRTIAELVLVEDEHRVSTQDIDLGREIGGLTYLTKSS